ncbi:monooxygenase [Geodermatophilus sp. Leaf369]|uniref:putative quinol monooxygenase n=1 Tax=Geodermatophilus sp. Leaf369 TaxID=1736354 RepID=UPI0006F547C0|nr:antibiotic biosynthesis monooxygenase [Geodermatophilus sp. Leaf369]KQS56746.1 monooxygenase [Geodermatophilus sp. Leaf369]
MTPNAVAVLISHRTRPGERDAVRAIWEERMAPAVADNPGHLAYVYCLDDGDHDRITAFQVYADAEAAAGFLRTEVYLAYEREVAPLLLGPPEVRRLTPTWSTFPG